MVKLLLAQHSVDVNIKDNESGTPLMYAALQGDALVEVVKLLLAQDGVDATGVDHEGKGATHYAEEKGHEEIVRLLEQRGVERITSRRASSSSSDDSSMSM